MVFGSADVTTGGMALRFYSSVRLEVRKGQAIKANGELVGTQVRDTWPVLPSWSRSMASWVGGARGARGGASGTQGEPLAVRSAEVEPNQ